VNIKKSSSTSEETGRRGAYNNWTQEENHFSDSSNTFVNIFIGSTDFNQELGSSIFLFFFTPIETYVPLLTSSLLLSLDFSMSNYFSSCCFEGCGKAYSDLREEAMARTLTS
jgi:hypothetical protein